MKYDGDKILKNMGEILANVKTDSFSNETMEFLSDFNSLTKENQLIIFRSFLASLEFMKDIQEEKRIKEKCAQEGHDYTPWYEKHSFECYNGSTFQNKVWCKKCSRCGYVEFTFVKPPEMNKKQLIKTK